MESTEIKRMIKRTEYYTLGDKIKVYIRTVERTAAEFSVAGVSYAEESNIREPYDFTTHFFTVDAALLESAGGFGVKFVKVGRRPTVFFVDGITEISEDVVFDKSSVISRDAAYTRADRGIEFVEVTGEGEVEGLSWVTELYKTPAGDPIRFFLMTADLEKVRPVCGTPGAIPEFKPKFIQRVVEECEELEKKGEKVLAATNGDFFDMFGDCKPSGLCVSGGIVVANGQSPNPFFAMTKSGKPFIGYLSEIDIDEIEEAIGGGQVLVRDGIVDEIAPLEPFGEIAHPRTAFGITADGKVLAAVVDGRRPVWSNGSPLCELASLMIKHGAVTALNTDGGGSSTFIVREDDKLKMLNHPADLVRPMEDLIRPLFNSLIFIKK